MGLLHFHFSFFLGCPDTSKSDFLRFWSPFGSLWDPLGVFLGSIERTWSALWSPLGTILVTMLISWGVLWRSRGCLGTSLAITLTVWMSKPRNSQLF